MADKEISFEEALQRAKRMSERYVERGPYQFFPQPEIVEEVQRGLAKNLVEHGHLFCPWMTLSGDPVEDRKKICPCERHHEDIARDGYCIWMFFVSEEFLRRYEETGEITPSTLGDVAPLGQTLFPADAEAERLPKSKRGPRSPAHGEPVEPWAPPARPSTGSGWAQHSEHIEAPPEAGPLSLA